MDVLGAVVIEDPRQLVRAYREDLSVMTNYMAVQLAVHIERLISGPLESDIRVR